MAATKGKSKRREFKFFSSSLPAIWQKNCLSAVCYACIPRLGIITQIDVIRRISTLSSLRQFSTASIPMHGGMRMRWMYRNT